MNKIQTFLLHIRERVEQSDIGKRMMTGAFWSFVGSVLARFASLVASIGCARILGKHYFGQLDLVRSNLNMFISFGGLGIGLMATKYISEYRKEHPERASSIYYVSNLFAVGFALFLAVLIFIFADWYCISVLNAPELLVPLQSTSFILAIIIFNVAEEGVLVGFEDFKAKALNAFYGGILSAALMLLGARYYGVLGAVQGYGLGFALTAALNKIAINRNFSRKGYKPSLRDFRKSDIRLLYTYSLPATLSSILAAPTMMVIRTLLVRHTDFSEAALFAASDQWRILILFVPTALGQIALPILSSIGSKSKNKFWKVLYANIALSGAVALLLAIIVSALSLFILSFYGRGYDNNVPMITLAFSCVFTALSMVFGASISSMARMWSWCAFNIVWGAIAIGSSWLFLRMGLGVNGVAYGVLLSYFCHALFQYIYLLIVRRKWSDSSENSHNNEQNS